MDIVKYVWNKKVIRARYNKLFFDDVEITIDINILNRFKFLNDIFVRFFRFQIYHIIPISGGLIIFAFKNIYKYSLVTKSIKKICLINGSRPLCIAKFSDEVVYGEYISNKKREAINVWKSKNGGENWEIIYTFHAIRHIHGIFYDVYEKCFWITTGDDDSESIIWKADLEFGNVEKFVFGKQKYRAVQLIITENSIFYGSDTPFEKNYIYKLDKKTKLLTSLREVEGSIFYGIKIKHHLFFSTVVEPSEVNLSKKVVIWHSANNGLTWNRFKVFKKDIWHSQLFQYGQVIFPMTEGDVDSLYFTPFATTSKPQIYKYTLEEIENYNYDTIDAEN